MLKAFSSCHDNHKQWLYAFSKVHCSNSNTNLILSDQITVNTLLSRKVYVKKSFHIFYCSWDSYQSLSSASSSSPSTDTASLSSSGLFVQSWRRHMSVHFKPFTIQEQDGSLQDLLYWQDSSSRTACRAGWPPIQSITSFPSSVHQPDPTGDGMSGHLCKLRLHTAAW